MADRLRLLLGKPIQLVENVFVHSPTLEEISEISEIEYSVNFVLSTFDKENILINLFGLSESDLAPFEEIDNFEVLTGNDGVTEEIAKSISFFVKQQVVYNRNENCFCLLSTEQPIINKNNYKNYSELVYLVNGKEPEKKEKKEKPKYMNKMVEQMHKLMEKQKQEVEKKKAKDSIDLKDIASILCYAEGNGVNVFNVGNLTIYQVFESFERNNLREMYLRVLPLWANGYFDIKKEKFPEWLVPTKL